MKEKSNVDSEFINSIFKIIWGFSEVEKVMLFGSYAKHTENVESDLDIAIFVDDKHYSKELFKNINMACSTSKMDIQIQLFTLEDFNNPCGIIQEVIEHGIDILPNKPYSI